MSSSTGIHLAARGLSRSLWSVGLMSMNEAPNAIGFPHALHGPMLDTSAECLLGARNARHYRAQIIRSECAPYRRDGSIERHLCHAPDSADDRLAAVVMRSPRRLTG